jgi:uncharacterized protein YggT (Ycf19 family)
MKKQKVVQVQQVVIDKNQTSLLTKLLRTLSFVLLLSVFLLFIMQLVFETQVEFILMDLIRPLLEPIQDIIATIDVLSNTFYILSALVVGLLLFTWTVSKSVLINVFLTVTIVLSYLVMLSEETLYISYMELLRPEFLNVLFDLINPLLEELLSLHEFVGLLIVFVTFILLTLLLVFRKPKRFSLTLVRVGVDLLLLALFIEFAKVVLIDSFIPANIYEYIKNYSFLIGYDFIALGSLFGILGFFRN